MPLSLYELANSRPIERTVDSGSETRKWIALYSNDQNAVAAALLIVAPKVWDTLRRTKYRCEPQGGGVWMCDVEYSWSADTQTDDPEDPKDPTDDSNLGPESSFDLTAATAHITQSLYTNTRWKPNKTTDLAPPAGPGPGDAIAYGRNATLTSLAGSSAVVTLDGYTYAAHAGNYLYVSGSNWKTGRYLITAGAGATVTVAGLPATRAGVTGGIWVIADGNATGTATNLNQAIGVTRDGVEGTEVFYPKFEFTWSRQVFPVNLPYLRKLRGVVAKTNNAPWRGFARGEILYIGATGQSQPGNVWTVSHRFACAENLYAIPIAPNLVVPQKNAWDYIWCTYGYKPDGTGTFSVPTSAYVEQVYREADFTLLGLGR